MMTTFQLPVDPELSGALSDVAAHLERKHDYAARSARELANASAPSNGFATASVPYAERGTIAAAAREVADGGHPLGDKLRDLAAGLDESVRAVRVNGGRI